MKSEKGQSLVEFALVIPILIMLLFGIIDFGRVFHAYLTIDHAGREAARAASVGEKNVGKIREIAVKQATSIGLSEGDVSVPGGVPSSGNDVTVRISHSVPFITPGISALKGSFPITDTTVMRVE